MTLDDLKAERAALEAAIAERAAMIERLVRDEARNSDRTPNAHHTVVTKSVSAPIHRRDNQAMTNEWQAYIAGEINRVSKGWIESSMSAVGQVLAEERKRATEELTKMRAEFELELTKLRAEFLQSELDRERGVKRHRNSEPGKASPLPVHSIVELN